MGDKVCEKCRLMNDVRDEAVGAPFSEAAFERLHAETFRVVWAMARRICRDESEAQDIARVAYLGVYRYWRDGKLREAPRRLLFRIATFSSESRTYVRPYLPERRPPGRSEQARERTLLQSRTDIPAAPRRRVWTSRATADSRTARTDRERGAGAGGGRVMAQDEMLAIGNEVKLTSEIMMIRRMKGAGRPAPFIT